MEIDANMTGAVIGRGGSKIKEIQEQCSVFMRVDKANIESGFVTVELQGDANGIKTAQDMINGVISERSGAREPQSRQDNRSGSYRQRPDNNYYQRESQPPDDFKLIDWNNINQAQAKKTEEMLKNLPALVKKLYRECPEVANLSPQEVQEIRKSNNNIMVQRTFEEKPGTTSAPIPNPTTKFEHCFADYPDVMEEIRKQGFQKPSPIQCQAWPVLMSGEDLIGIAQTGSGKTLAFLLPGMIHTEMQPTPRGKRGGPNVLILAPTRELALQIRDEVAKYNFRDMKSVCVYGGGSTREQIEVIDRGVEIVIATPGRLNDLVEKGTIDVSTITYLVLDEADRMLDMGFEPQIRKVLLDIRPDRQTVMTSATWPPGVRRLAQSYMNNPIQVYVGTLDLAAVHTVSQNIEIVEDTEKFDRILEFVRNMSPTDKAIIFCGRKTGANELAGSLVLEGFECQCIHGDREQADREQAVKDIKSGSVKILVATDVASRGLDIEDITYVVNYDFPRNIEEYVHRVGRTGRAGRTGVSLSLMTRKDWGSAEELIRILEEAAQEVPEELRSMADRFNAMKERRENERALVGGRPRGGGGGGGGGGGRRFNQRW
ncbi:RNA helicase [Sergentomyia squamirostris]